VTALRRAALLHDLGRAAVSNGIWDKAGPLDAAEREQVRMHAHHAERVLRQAPTLAELVPLVANHHERLDGSGYHRGLPAAELDRGSRLLAACDVFHALTERRPWRPALSPQAAARDLHQAATGGAWGARRYRPCWRSPGNRRRLAAAPGPMGGRTARSRSCAWSPRGLSNEQIGQALPISPVTAKNHIAHLYEKTGIATRSAAALYAVTKGLVQP